MNKTIFQRSGDLKKSSAVLMNLNLHQIDRCLEGDSFTFADK